MNMCNMTSRCVYYLVRLEQFQATIIFGNGLFQSTSCHLSKGVSISFKSVGRSFFLLLLHYNSYDDHHCILLRLVDQEYPIHWTLFSP